MPQSPRHVAALDGIRGFAALCVLSTHYALHLFQDAPGYPAVTNAMNAVDRTPMHVVFASYSWVNVFFVLSGFALSAMVARLGATRATYLPYAISRVFRIYPVYIIVVLGTMLLQPLVYRGPIAAFGDWFNSSWTAPATLGDVRDHAIMIGRFNANKFVFVIWSLVHEMRISLLFPIIYAAVTRLGARGNVGAVLGLLALDVAWSSLADAGYLAPNTYYFTLHYAVFFWVGSAIFRFREPLKRWWDARHDAQIALLGVVGFVLFSYGSNVEALLPPDAMRTAIAADWVGGPGVVLCLLFALYCAPLARFLSSPPLRFIGALSYSLYLVHGTVLLAALHAFHGVVPLGLLLAGCVVASFAISLLSFTLIEKPFMRLGKRIAGAVARART